MSIGSKKSFMFFLISGGGGCLWAAGVLSLDLRIVLGVFAMGNASLAVVNAKVWTGNRGPTAQALAVNGERLMAVGSNEAIAGYVGRETEVLDAAGRLVLPGFNDSHVHLLLGGRQLTEVDLRQAGSESEFAALIGERARSLTPGRWLRGGNWDHEEWSGGRLPTKEAVDKFTPATPVFVTRLDLHVGLANSRALALAGITRDTADPPGGTIVRDADGEPTGVLKDAAMDLVRRVMPPYSQEEDFAALAKAEEYAVSLGITSLQDMSGWDWADWEALRAYRIGRQPLVRVCVRTPLADWQHQQAAVMAGEQGDDWLRLGGVKAFVDGSLGASTALFFAPYDDSPGCGLLMQPPEVLAAQATAADQAGLQLAIHAIGDKANAVVLDVFAQVAAANGPRDRRPRVEHAQHLVRGDIDRMAALGVIASVQPYHAADDGRWAEKRIGAERAKLTYAFRSLQDAGVRLVFGTDWPVAPPNPLLTIQAAVTRQTGLADHVDGWQPAEKLDVAAAVTAYTAAGAYGEFAEDRKGTLTPGLLADFVILSKDIFSLPPTAIASAEVVCTVCGGRVVYRK